jgi:hypothetical protein
MEHVAAPPGTAYVVIAGPEVIDAEFDRLVGWLRAATAVRGEKDEEDE